MPSKPQRGSNIISRMLILALSTTCKRAREILSEPLERMKMLGPTLPPTNYINTTKLFPQLHYGGNVSAGRNCLTMLLIPNYI